MGSSVCKWELDFQDLRIGVFFYWLFGGDRFLRAFGGRHLMGYFIVIIHRFSGEFGREFIKISNLKTCVRYALHRDYLKSQKSKVFVTL